MSKSADYLYGKEGVKCDKRENIMSVLTDHGIVLPDPIDHLAGGFVETALPVSLVF